MIERTGNDLLVIASHPKELAEGQLAMIEHVKGKELESQTELMGIDELMERCKKMKMSTATVKRLRVKIESRLKYLSKVRSALEQGFVIVPNFPGATIAVRVAKDNPDWWRKDRRFAPVELEEESKNLLEGEGKYVNPTIEAATHARELSDGVIQYSAWNPEYDEELAMPIEFLKPRVMELTTDAMARKLFDEIAITGNPAVKKTNIPVVRQFQKGDPMVLGRLVDKKNKKRVTFLIAWFVDSKDVV